MASIIDQLIVIEKKMRNAEGAKEAHPLLIKLHPQLQKTTLQNTSPDDYYSNWSFYFRMRLGCEQELGLSTEETAKEMIALLGWGQVSEEILFSNDSVALRIALRAAYTQAAQYDLQAGRLESAVQNIDQAFRIKSSLGEYEDPFFHSYETQARVYREAAKRDAGKYQNSFLASLQVLEKKMDDSRFKLQDPSLKSDLQSEAYQNSKSEDPIEKLKRGPKGETWKQALDRMNKLNEILGLKPPGFEDDPDEETMQVLEILKPETEATLKAAETKHKTSIPKTLRDCLLTHGAFRANEDIDWGSFRIYSSQQYETASIFSGLVSAVDGLWGGRPEFAESFSEDEIKFLNENYFCFGHYKVDDNAYKHLFFDRKGNFDDLYYHQDEWGDAEELFRALLSESSAKYTFDAEIASCVDEVIERLLEVKEERDNEI